MRREQTEVRIEAPTHTLPPPGQGDPRTQIIREKPSLKSQFLISGIWHVILNPATLMTGIPAACIGILWLFGYSVPNPMKSAMAHRVEVAKEKAEAKIDQKKGGIGGKIDDAKSDVIDALSQQGIETAKRKEAAEREHLIVEARDLGVPFEPDWTTDKLRAEVQAAREEQVVKQPLYDRARAAGLVYLPIWPSKELRHNVEKREKWLAGNEAYQGALQDHDEAMGRYEWELRHGKNARCPGGCGYQMRINPAWARKDLQCPACRTFFTGVRAIALGVKPKKPKPPVLPKPWSLF